MRKRTHKALLPVIGATAILAVALAGCRGQGDGMSDSQKATADKMQEIASKSGGDWDKLSQADRSEYLKATNGSEPAAKMLFQARTGKLRGNPGGAPKR